jgi:hypothetical protein
VGVDVDGIKHVLGIWVQTAEGAKFWAGVCAELANRGIKDVLSVCRDGKYSRHRDTARMNSAVGRLDVAPEGAEDRRPRQVWGAGRVGFGEGPDVLADQFDAG